MGRIGQISHMGRIGHIGHMRRISLMGLMGLMGLMASCSDELQPEARSAAVELKGCVTRFEENVARRAAGTWTVPTGYSLYGEPDKSISVFFTQTTADPAGGYEEEFFFKSSGKWRVSKTDLAQATYYLYGYAPHEAYVDARVAKLSGEGKTFAHGAVLTLENLNAIMSSDLCAIIGAKNGKTDYHDDVAYEIEGLQRGNFAYAAETTGESSTGANRVYLLLDHLYAALNIQMKVHGDYAALRTIKLRELHLKAVAGSDTIKNKTTATITLTANAEGDDPITSVAFAPTIGDGDDNADCKFFESKEGEKIETDYNDTPYACYFMPKDVTKVVLFSTYDVYDTKGNLIREGCIAKNTLDITKLFDRQTEALRGRRYTVRLTIKPTYLYMLSDPDLNNPTLEVN